MRAMCAGRRSIGTMPRHAIVPVNSGRSAPSSDWRVPECTPAPTSFSSCACSYTSTSMPTRSSASAAVSPPMPPPAMSTRGMPANILDRMRLTLACGRYDRTQALIDDRVRIEGVEELNYLAPRPGETFWRMLNHEEFDASEMSLSSYSILRSEGDTRFIAIPVFPSRVFRQNALYVHAESYYTRTARPERQAH